jgi:hypothetical protein
VDPSPGSLRKRLALSSGLLVMSAFYTWTALPERFSARPLPNPPPGTPGHYAPPGPRQLYNALAEALLAGRTSLLIKPRPELLALADPYDPLQNHEIDAQGLYCLHDASLFGGKYYVYFGVTPALTLFAPYLFVTGHHLPTAVAALIFAVAGLLWSALLLNLLIDRYSPTLNGVMRFLLVLALGCCNCVPFLLRSPYVYEVAILSAYCFVAGGLYFVARGCLGDTMRRWKITVGSLFLGLAIGCRPHMALVALLIFCVAGIWLFALAKQRKMAGRQVAAVTGALVGPWLAIVLLLAGYNYHRFHSFTEFGARYNLVGSTIRVVDLPVLDWHRLQADLFCYLFFPPRLQSRFPYVHLDVPDAGLLPPGHFGVTPIAGVLAGMPFLLILVVAPAVLRNAWREKKWSFLAALVVLLGGGAAELVCVACFGGAMRYAADFANLLVIAALLVSFDGVARCRPMPQRLMHAAVTLGVIMGCLFNVAISIEGQRCLARDIAVRDQMRHIFPRLRLLDSPRNGLCQNNRC